MGAHFEEPVSNIAERLKEALKLRHMKASELSRLTNITTASLSHYIAGRYIPKQDKLYLLSKALRVSPAWLQGFNVSIDGQALDEAVEESANIAKEEPKEYIKLHSTISPSKESRDYLRQQAEELCRIAQEVLISPEDKKLLDRYHALAPDSQILVMSMIEKLLLTQESTMKGEAHEKKEETA